MQEGNHVNSAGDPAEVLLRDITKALGQAEVPLKDVNGCPIVASITACLVPVAPNEHVRQKTVEVCP